MAASASSAGGAATTTHSVTPILVSLQHAGAAIGQSHGHAQVTRVTAASAPARPPPGHRCRTRVSGLTPALRSTIAESRAHGSIKTGRDGTLPGQTDGILARVPAGIRRDVWQQG